MKATVYFLVKVADPYNNKVTLSNGMEIFVNNTVDSVEHVNRVGVFLDGPAGSMAEPGDQLLFHHNICRESWNKKSKRKSVFFIKDNIYYIPLTEIYMIKKRGSDDWQALDPYVFVKPIPATTKKLHNGLEVMEDSYKKMKDLMGIVTHPNKALKEAGVDEGDLVTFMEDSEHEFKIGEQIYYRMETKDILTVHET